MSSGPQVRVDLDDLKEKAAGMNERIAILETRVGFIERKLDNLEIKFDGLDKKMNSTALNLKFIWGALAVIGSGTAYIIKILFDISMRLPH